MSDFWEDERSQTQRSAINMTLGKNLSRAGMEKTSHSWHLVTLCPNFGLRKQGVFLRVISLVIGPPLHTRMRFRAFPAPTTGLSA